MIFDDLSVSGLLICYGPLAVTIIGFVLFAAMTDLDTRRTYLRVMELAPEDELPPTLPPKVTTRTRAETPSGSKVILIPPESAVPQVESDVVDELDTGDSSDADEAVVDDTTVADVDDDAADEASDKDD